MIMISEILQRLETLRVDLSVIDPAHDIEAADKVAAIASALRRTVEDVGTSERGSEPSQKPALARDAA